MKWFDKLKEDKKLRVVTLLVIAMWSFYFVMNMFFVFGQMNVCSNMNGTIVKDHGDTVCINAVEIPICEDSLGVVYRGNGNNSFDYSSITID